MSVNSTLLLAVFFFLIGAAVMGIIWYLQNIARGGYKEKNASSSDSNLAEVARLFRDKTTQDLVVTMNGNVFHDANQLNPGQSRRLHFASDVLVKWLGESPPPSPASDATPATPQESTSPAEEWVPVETVAPGDQLAHIPPFVAEPAEEVKPVSIKITDVVSGILNPAPPQPEPKSIALQIDAILQDMIADTTFEERGISVNDAPDHGVMVTLDGKQYPGVKDVPDEEVRNLIRSAVVEWEKSGKFSSR